MLSNITVAFADVDIIANGKCGTNLTWTLDNDGNMIINGTGDMSLWLGSEIHAPWYIYRTDIKDVVIDNGVTNIGHSAFEDCSNLTSITISDSVSSIGNCAFQSCTKLTRITIPNGVTNIGSAAFEYCKNLTNITIPKSVTNIGSSAFYGCNVLESITYEGSKNDWDNITINYMNSVLDNAEIVFSTEGTQNKKICSKKTS